MNDAEFLLTDINPDRIASAGGEYFCRLYLFLGILLIASAILDGVKVHSGFQDTFERTADDVLAAVQQTVADTGATQVLATGHSLGEFSSADSKVPQ